MSDMTPKEVAEVIDRAIVLLPKFVPAEHRTPVVGGGQVLGLATAILVASRALFEAALEVEKKAGP